MQSSRAAGLAAALALSLSAGIVGTAHAEPTAPPTATDSSPQSASSTNASETPITPATTSAPEETSSTEATPSSDATPSAAASETPSSPATPESSIESTPYAAVSTAVRAVQIEKTAWIYISADLRTGASSSFRSMGRTAPTHALIRRGPNYNGWAPVLYKNTQGWVPANTVTTWHPQTQWIYVETELRTGASNSFRSMGRTHATTVMVRRGPNHHGWAPVFYKGKQGWLPGNTVTSTRPQTFWVKKDQTMRAGASTSFRSMGTAHQGTRVVRRGPNRNGWMPVVFNNMQSWIPATAVSSRPVAAPVSVPINNSGAHLDRRCMTGTVICASKKQRKLWMVQNGRILITLDARFGRSSEPTAEGVNTVYWKDKNHVSGVYGTPMPYSMFFHGGQAIHYSSDFSRRGWNGASHGCINIRNMPGLKWLWNKTPTGRKVIVFK